jgi:hypothetical protein
VTTATQLDLDGVECEIPRHDPRCTRMAEEAVAIEATSGNLHDLVDDLRRWELVELIKATATLVLEARRAVA